jgi:Ice-binding-like/PEP-CTERM motif
MKRNFLGLAVVIILVGLTPSYCAADAVNLGAASSYVVLDIGGTPTIMSGFAVYQSATVINGNVGEGPNSVWSHGIDATINGKLFYDTTDSLPVITGTITGGTFQQSMVAAITDALNASTFAAALTPTQTFTTLTSGQTITGNGGLNVIRVTGDVGLSGGGTTLNLVGGASDIFIFQLTASDATSAHELTLSGVTMNIGGVSANNILWDLNGGGGNVVISSGATVYGTFLAPDRSVTVDQGTILGRVIAGGSPNPTDNSSNSLIIHSSSQITSPTAVPEPSTFSLLAAALLGLTALGFARRRFNS